MREAMINHLRKLGKRLRPQDQHHVLTPQDSRARFELRYGTLSVGELWIEDGVWHFNYSEAFRRQDDVKPLIDFPDPEPKEPYTSDELWPYFAVRIPGLAQPAIQRALEALDIDPNNEVDLLRTFGKKTIGDPFTLEPA